jgi:hypothetical protein
MNLKTLKIFSILVAAYVLMIAPIYIWGDKYLNSAAGIIAVLPYLSIYLFHGLGIPGLLQQNGNCGWGWCSPTALGWIVIVIFWCGVLWGLAWLISRATRSNTRSP